MLQKDFLFIITNFTKALDQALEIDPKNTRASLILTEFLCNAPPIAGGNAVRGQTPSTLMHEM